MNDMTEEMKNEKEDTPKDPAQEDYEAGKKFLDNKDLPQAANAFHNALIGFEQNSNENGIANACDKLGDICMTREEYSKALELYKRAFDICEHLDDPASILALQKKMAQCHRSQKQLTETLKIYLDMLDTFYEWKNPGLTVDMLTQLGELYCEMNEKEKGKDAYLTAASIHANYGHKRMAKQLEDKAAAIEQELHG